MQVDESVGLNSLRSYSLHMESLQAACADGEFISDCRQDITTISRTLIIIMFSDKRTLKMDKQQCRLTTTLFNHL